MKRVNDTSIVEEIINASIHGIGSILGIVGFIYLISAIGNSHNIFKIISFIVFGISLILMYLTSTLFHGLTFTKAYKVFKILDHSAIFVFIAGCYTPIALVLLRNLFGWIVLMSVWIIAIVGIVIKAVAIDKVRTILPYLILGWLGVVLVVPLYSKIPLHGIFLLILGGLFYTFGTVFYSWKNLRFSHCVWHLFVLGGTACHYMLMYSLK